MLNGIPGLYVLEKNYLKDFARINHNKFSGLHNVSVDRNLYSSIGKQIYISFTRQ